MLTIFVCLSIYLLHAAVLWTRPAQTSDQADPPAVYPSIEQEFPLEYKLDITYPSTFFLRAYISAMLIRFSIYLQATQNQSQLFLLAIRQVLTTMHFGRGLLHS